MHNKAAEYSIVMPLLVSIISQTPQHVNKPHSLS